jgi:hypothetical protein
MGKFYISHNCNYAWEKIIHLSTQSKLGRIYSCDKFNDAWGNQSLGENHTSDF